MNENKTPIRYAGGKSKAIKHIIPYFQKDLRTVVAPFMGGGSIEVNLTNMGIKVIGYDVFKPLVIFWNELINDNQNLVNFLKRIKPTDENYKLVKEKLIQWEYTQEMLKNWKTDFYKRENPIKLSDLEVAGYYYFNHNTSYGPGYLGWASSIYLNEESWLTMIRNVGNFKTRLLSVYEGDYIDVITDNNKEFMYLDPPYYMGGNDNKMHAPIYPMKNIPVHHAGFNHEKLRDLLYNHKGKFILSYNNCETIREYYKDFKLVFPSWNYSMGNGETRIGKNREREGIANSKESHEILIIKD